MSSEFGFGERREYAPQHGDINWEAVFQNNHPDSTAPPAWFEHTDELGFLQIQLCQENTVVWLNQTDPKFDCICIADPRDGNAFWFSRDRIGSEGFDQIANAIGSEVLVARTRYPTKPCVEYVMMCAMREIDNLIPEQQDGTE